MTHICVIKLIIIDSDNGLAPVRRQAIIWTNAGILSIGPFNWNKLQWKFNRNSYIFIQENAFENVVWKMASILSRPQCVKWQLVCKFSIVERNLLFIFCFYACFIHYLSFAHHFPHKWVLLSHSFIILSNMYCHIPQILYSFVSNVWI